jgi:hypothetical protein
MTQPTPNVEVSQDRIDGLLALAAAAPFPPQEYDLLKFMLGTFLDLVTALQKARTSVKRLRGMLFGTSTESKANIEKAAGEAAVAAAVAAAGTAVKPEPKGKGEGDPPKQPGHGRNGAAAYPGAAVVQCRHADLKPGDPCPNPDCTGKLYPAEPRSFIKVTGNAPLSAIVYDRESFRCRLCNYIATAPLPDGVGGPKYDEKAASMVIIYRYAAGMPFFRLQGVQKSLGVPLPDATQWDIVRDAAKAPRHVYAELQRQAAQGTVLHNDDTHAQILSESGKRREKADAAQAEAKAKVAAGAEAKIKAEAEAEAKAKAKAEVEAEAEAKAKAESAAKAIAAGGRTRPKAATRADKAAAKKAEAAAMACAKARAKADKAEAKAAKAKAAAEAQATQKTKAVQTTCILSLVEGREVTLYFTGRAHAGQNMAKVLAQRPAGMGAPIQMSDALTVNVSGDFETILCQCLSHGRRKFAEVAEHFPAHSLRMIQDLAAVYQHDKHCKKECLSPGERLAYHQANSGPLMDGLKAWMDGQLKDKLVEPNSGLGEAMRYMIKHWHGMTQFLRVAGAPLDNNICERALKKSIIHRKNSYFYRNANGAEVGDIYMSLIHTCQPCGANPFDYLTQLQLHADRVEANPELWLPWNYREATAAATAGVASTP